MELQLPTSVSSERIIIGCLLQDIGYLFLHDLETERFYADENKKIIDLIKKCALEKKEITEPIFTKEMSNLEVSYYDYMAEVVVIPTEATYIDYVNAVEEAYRYRQTIQIAQRIYSMGYSQADFAEISREIHKLANLGTTEQVQTLYHGAIEALGDDTPKFICGTGYNAIDDIVKGVRAGGLTLIGARPGAGKSTLALNLVDKVLSQGVKCAFFSTEMSAREIQERYICIKSNVSMMLLDDRTPEVIDKAVNALAKVDYAFDCSIYDSIQSFEKVVMQIHKECSQGTKVIVVDYIQQLPIDTRRGTRAEMLGNISTKLKQLAKQYDANIICCAQLNRELEKRANKRPTKSDLKDCGTLEQDADVVMLLEVHEDNDQLLNIYIDKNRQGPDNLMAQVHWTKKYFLLHE